MWENTTYPHILGLFGAVRVPHAKGLNCWFDLVKSLFCPINASPDEFLVRTSPDPPPHSKSTFLRGGGGLGVKNVNNGSFPVFVFVDPWTGLSSLVRTSKSQPRSGWRHKPKKFKNSESNSPEWQ